MQRRGSRNLISNFMIVDFGSTKIWLEINDESETTLRQRYFFPNKREYQV